MSEWEYSYNEKDFIENYYFSFWHKILQIEPSTANLLHCKHPKCLSSELSGHWIYDFLFLECLHYAARRRQTLFLEFCMSTRLFGEYLNPACNRMSISEPGNWRRWRHLRIKKSHRPSLRLISTTVNSKAREKLTSGSGKGFWYWQWMHNSRRAHPKQMARFHRHALRYNRSIAEV